MQIIKKNKLAEYTISELLQEAKLIKNYLEQNSYISDIFDGIPYSFSARECEGKTVPQIAELLKIQVSMYK